MNNLQKRLLAAGAVVLILAAAFWHGGGAPGRPGEQTHPPISSAASSAPPLSPDETEDSRSALPDASAPAWPQGDSEPPSPVRESTPSNSPAPPGASSLQGGSSQQADSSAQPPNTNASAPSSEETVLTCTLSIRCDTILDHWDWLNPDKAELVPADGILLAAAQVSVPEGETAFDLLRRQTRAAGMHMEAAYTPGYGSSYVEGIANLYEFDCGPQSGWTYLVNGISPSYGSSQYVLSDGDVVEWVYTCDLGKDVGGGGAT